MKKTNEASASTRRRIHRTPAQWQALLSAQAQSGLSQQAFCERERVSTVSLSNWRKRLREGGASPIASAALPPPFIELTNAASPLDAGIKVRIELGAGVVLELSRA